MRCARCGTELDPRKPHVTFTREVERHTWHWLHPFGTTIKVLDAEVVDFFCLRCGGPASYSAAPPGMPLP